MDVHSRPRQFSGQLCKYTNVMKGWQYRYFMVDGSAGLLQYFLYENDKPEHATPRGSVHLAGAVICPSEDDSRTFTVNCASGDMLKLRAMDAKERQEWVNGLRAVAEAHTKAISDMTPPLPPREHLAVQDAMGSAKTQLERTEQTDIALARLLDSAGNLFINDTNLLLMKATSAASIHCLLQCFNILQRNQHQQARTGFAIDDD